MKFRTVFYILLWGLVALSLGILLGSTKPAAADGPTPASTATATVVATATPEANMALPIYVKFGNFDPCFPGWTPGQRDAFSQTVETALKGGVPAGALLTGVQIDQDPSDDSCYATLQYQYMPVVRASTRADPTGRILYPSFRRLKLVRRVAGFREIFQCHRRGFCR